MKRMSRVQQPAPALGLGALCVLALSVLGARPSYG